MMNRRNFVKTVSASAALVMLAPQTLMASGKINKIGIQLYSLRNQIGNDFLGTLRKIADAGYKIVEAAGYGDRKFYGYAPEEYKKIVTDLGMLPLSTHNGISPENADTTIEDCKNAGMDYIVLPSIPAEKRKTLDDYRAIAGDFNRIGQKCSEAGIKFGYHNHAFEFEQIDGQTPYDILLNNTDPNHVFFQIDFFWVAYGGREPIEYLNNFPGRFALWHAKDMLDPVSKKNVEVGSGFIRFEEAFKVAGKAGLEYVVVEQEEFEMDPFVSIKKSFDYLNMQKF